MSRLIFLVLASCVAVSYGQTFGFGGCPPVVAMTPIDVTKLNGKWYEYARSVNSVETTGTCQTSTFAVTGNNLTVTNKQYDSLLKGAEKTEIGKAVVNTTIGKATVVYPGGSVPYTILKTDYTTYMAVESCTDLFLFHFKNLWVLTRARLADQVAGDAAYAAFTAQNFDTKSLNKTDQFWCPLFH